MHVFFITIHTTFNSQARCIANLCKSKPYLDWKAVRVFLQLRSNLMIQKQSEPLVKLAYEILMICKDKEARDQAIWVCEVVEMLVRYAFVVTGLCLCDVRRHG